MIENLTCFKCYNDTATLTYEENRIYKVSCPCGCEYDFEHSSMKCAEEYHCKMIELYGEIDRSERLQRENSQLRELVANSEAMRKTGDVAPVVHGEWDGWTTSAYIGIDAENEPKWADRKFFRCAICRYGTVVKSNYCPNCGAKMELGVEV